MRAELKNTPKFRKALAVVGELVNEGNFVASDAGLAFTSMDSSHVALVSLTLAPGAAIGVEGAATFGVKIEHLNRVLACAGENVTLEIHPDASDVLRVTSDTARFELKLLDIDSEDMSVPPMTPDAEIEVSSAALQQVVKELSFFGDTVRVTVGDTITLEASGDFGTASIDLEDARVTRTVKTAEVGLDFGLRYLSTFCKAAGVSPTVTLGLSRDMPLHVRYVIGGGGGYGTLEFWLAPKIEDDDM